MIRISTLIVDDEELARDGVRRLLAEDSSVHLLGEASQGLQARAMIQTQRPELIFLDIRMPECDGFDVLADLDETTLPVVVFTTAYDQFAIRAFESHAVDYLLKPYSDGRFFSALEHAKRQVELRRIGNAPAGLTSLLQEQAAQWLPEEATSFPKHIAIKRGKSMEFIKVEAIDWIGAADYYVEVHLGGKHYLIRESMQALSNKLDPQRFVRIHRSYLVNIDRVTGIQPGTFGEPQVKLIDGSLLKLSRPGRDRLNQILRLL